MTRTSTIFALSSGALPSGVAVVRISGPDVRDALVALRGTVPPSRKLVLSRLIAADGSMLDHALVAFFPGPTSFTGEDCAELHLHGGRAVVSAVLARLGALPGFRSAERGEFTRRAFVNGKVDLTAAEALSDLLEAETEAQRRLAIANAEGRQHRLYEGWRGRLLQARALIEAELDFADEEDVPGSVADRVWADMDDLRREIADHMAGFRAAEIVRDGFKVAIIGAPNAGKSSLLNHLAGRDAAIVSDEPGTTRDPIELSLNIGGSKVVLTDTAGIRHVEPGVEALGIERSRRAAAEADLVLALEDIADPLHFDCLEGPETLRIGTKLDLVHQSERRYDLTISTKTGEGVEALLALIERRSSQRLAGVESGPVPTRQRHVDLLSAAHAALLEALDPDLDLEMRAEGIRIAGLEIGRVSGAIEVEEILGAIFSKFCIGK